MLRSRAFKRGRWLSLLAAGLIGYLIGDWHAIAWRAAELSPSQTVALRFPAAKADPVLAAVAAETPAGATNATNTLLVGDTQIALLSPDPMSSAMGSAIGSVPARQAAVPLRVAAVEESVALSSPAKAASRLRGDAKPMAAGQPKAELKAAALREANRPGFVLNDAQIASIKTRLHLSRDQEQMWPAVEAALRNIAYANARDGRRRGGAGNAAGNTDVASLDPYGPEVQGLKSAAFPLIMSFSDEQRSEVRSLAHVMGLDQLASQL
jgi:hypothetical protein